MPRMARVCARFCLFYYNPPVFSRASIKKAGKNPKSLAFLVQDGLSPQQEKPRTRPTAIARGDKV